MKKAIVPVVPSAIREQIARDVKKYVDMAKAHFKREYDYPQITYNLRGRTAGEAHGTRLIKINPILLMENLEDMIANTVPHEVAHSIDSANGDNRLTAAQILTHRGRGRPKRSIHGPSWQHIMRVFGVKDITRCHKYDVTNARVSTKKKFEYKCGNECGKTFMVSAVLHNRMRMGQKRFCRRCGATYGRLVFVSGPGQTTSRELTFAEREVPPPPRTRAHSDFLNQVVNILQQPAAVESILKPVRETHGYAKLAKDLYWQYGGQLTRGQFLVRAAERGIKAATASTYYANLKAGRM